MVLIKKSIKEQLMNMDKKQRKEFIRELREKRKPQFKSAQQAKVLWEKLRSSKTSANKKEDLSQQLFDLVKGSTKQLIFAHDTSRVLQSLLTFGTPEIRNAIFDELTPEIIRMSKSQYARFFVVKMLKHGNKHQKEVIINALFGHFSNLLQSKVSAKIVELIFNDYATASQRFDILSEFYGKEFILFRTENRFKSLKEIQAKCPEKMAIILKNVHSVLTNLTDKEQFKLTISHKLLADFLLYCTNAQKLEMLDLIKERLPEICHTKEGADICMDAIWSLNVKDRKIIVKGFKGLAVKCANDQFARRVLFCMFDSIDDTTLLNKIITKEIADNIADVIYDKWGVSVLHYVVHPRDKSVFGQTGLVDILKRGDDNEFSKKKPADRYKQIFDCLKESLYTFMAANMREILFNKTSAVLVLNSLEPSAEDEPFVREVEAEWMTNCFEKIAEIAGEEFILDYADSDKEKEKHIMQGGAACYVLKKLIKADRQQASVKISDFMAKLPKSQLNLFSTSNSGCFDLYHMTISGSEVARDAVVNAINMSSLKNKQGFPGAQLLLEEVSK